MRCRRLPTSTTDHTRLLGAPRARTGGFHRLDSPRTPGAPGREVAKTFTGRGDGVLVGVRTLEEEARRYWTTTHAGYTTGAATASALEHRESSNYPFHAPVLAVSVSLDHERTERSSNSAASLSPHVVKIAELRSLLGAVARLVRELRDKELAWRILFQLPWLRVLFC